MLFHDLLLKRAKTPSEASQEMGVDVSTVCRWNRREHNPTGENLQKLLVWAAGSMSLDEALKTKLQAGDDPTVPVSSPTAGEAA